VVIQAYVTTMAATAMTMRSSVANIGDMAFLECNIFRIDIFLIPAFTYGTVFILYLTCMKQESAFQIIRKPNKKRCSLAFRGYRYRWLILDKYP